MGCHPVAVVIMHVHKYEIKITKSPTHKELRYAQSQIHIKKYINNALITIQPMKNTTHKRKQ